MRSIAGFSPSPNFEQAMSHPSKRGLAVSKWGPPSQSFKTIFFKIAGTSEAETLVSGKAECLLAKG